MHALVLLFKQAGSQVTCVTQLLGSRNLGGKLRWELGLLVCHECSVGVFYQQTIVGGSLLEVKSDTLQLVEALECAQILDLRSDYFVAAIFMISGAIGRLLHKNLNKISE